MGSLLFLIFSSCTKDDDELGFEFVFVFCFFFSCCTQRHHVSCRRFNVIINKFSIIKINL
jgi:hypothetical protein